MDIQTLVDACQTEPMAIVVGDHHDPEQAFLISENKVVCDIKLKVPNIPIFLLAMFYVFNK